jgi:hypothetical protein
MVHIDNKMGEVVPFRLNRAQMYFQRNKSSRNIILKARQIGISSSILADMFVDCITIPHTTCAVVSHETHSTQRLLDRVQFYYDAMTPPKPAIGAESRSEKTFPSLHSIFYVGTAGSRAFGRGDTIRKALLSEASFYEDGEKIWNGCEDAVPITGELTAECSPNGEDNIFYERWVKAREGKSPYKPFFFPWWWSDDYRIPKGSTLALPEDCGALSYSVEEQNLVTANDLHEDQIRWRRWKIAEKGGLFFQEYPEDEVSCFITIGDPVFNSDLLTSLAQKCYEGELHATGGWKVFVPPEDGLRYTIGADSAAGSPTGSYSTAVVLNDRWEVCATFQARLEPHPFAKMLKELGSWYNNAEIAIERNFTGYAVLEQLRDYGNIYYQRDFTTGRVTTQKGWWTNDQTRELLMTVTKEKLPYLKIWDINLIRQLRSYRYLKIKTKLKEESQTFDDLAIALMIACCVKKIEGGSRGFQGAVSGWSW